MIKSTLYFYTPLLKVFSGFLYKKIRKIWKEKNIKKLVFALIAHFARNPEYNSHFRDKNVITNYLKTSSAKMILPYSILKKNNPTFLWASWCCLKLKLLAEIFHSYGIALPSAPFLNLATSFHMSFFRLQGIHLND